MMADTGSVTTYRLRKKMFFLSRNPTLPPDTPGGNSLKHEKQLLRVGFVCVVLDPGQGMLTSSVRTSSCVSQVEARY